MEEAVEEVEGEGGRLTVAVASPEGVTLRVAAEVLLTVAVAAVEAEPDILDVLDTVAEQVEAIVLTVILTPRLSVAAFSWVQEAPVLV